MRLQLTGAVLLALVARPGTAEQITAGPREPPAGAVSTKHVTGRFYSELSAYSDSDHVEVLTPSISAEIRDVTAGWSARGDYLLDAISAASVDIVSTASPHWTEVRHAGAAQGAFKSHGLGVTGAGSLSSEPDYLAWGAGGSASRSATRPSGRARHCECGMRGFARQERACRDRRA